MDAIASSKKEDGNLSASAPQFRHNGPAIFFWQHHVDNQKVVVLRAREFQGCFAIFCNVHGKTIFPKTLGEKGCCLSFVFDQQDSHLSEYRSPTSSLKISAPALSRSARSEFQSTRNEVARAKLISAIEWQYKRCNWMHCRGGIVRFT